MFNLGAGEIVVLLLLALIFFGPLRLPELAQVVRSRVSARPERRWSWTDLLLLCAAVMSATAALAIFMSTRR